MKTNKWNREGHVPRQLGVFNGTECKWTHHCEVWNVVCKMSIFEWSNLTFVLLLEKNEQPHDSQMRKDGFRLREGSREMGCDSDCWEGAGMEGRSGLLLSICREGTPRVCVVTPTSLPRGSCFLAPTGWFTGTVGGLEAASASGCPFHFVRKLSPPDLDGLGTQDKRCLWTFNYWGLFSSQGRNIELQVWSSAWQVVHELPC